VPVPARTEPTLTMTTEARTTPVLTVDPVPIQPLATPTQPPRSELVQTSPQTPTDDAPIGTPFRTRHAYFEPASFRSLPGWGADRTTEAWQAFQASCRALSRNPAWNDACGGARAVDSRSDASIRRFFESHFALYQIHEPDRSPAGVITGYYEPLLRGSRTYGTPYVHPVYGLPRDLVYLEAGRLPRDARRRAVPARLEGRNVIPLPGSAAQAASDAYTLEVGEAQPDSRDKRIRLRVEGHRIRPYYTRAEIEQARLPGADVLAWVADPAALYSMQIQGSGKVQLPDGKILRLAYAEQNGQPFVPALQALAPPAGKAERPPLTRGLGLLAAEAQDREPVLTRSLTLSPARPGGAASGRTSPEVARMIEALRPTQAPSTSTAGPQAPRTQSLTPTSATRPDADPRRANPDPSYVFFRPIPDSSGGPIGALGVPLTAGRSVAVDPRTTPLGFPVFIATNEPGGGPSLNRLVLAQDTGGAIRGAVRADYFWGFGPSAGAAASRMKETGRMWLLVPKAQPLAALAANVRTRGTVAVELDCVVPDPEFCVEG
jgi:membrane-bound lytic murein transglycosylase A